MSELTGAQRVMRVLRGDEPDRIAHFEWIIDRKVRDAICPGCTMEEFTVRMGLDAILTAPDFSKEQIGPGRYRNEWGVICAKTGEEHGLPVEGPIKTIEDLRKYTPPDPHAAGRYESLKRVVERYKGKLAIGVHLNDVLSIPRYLAGFERLMMAFATDPQFVHELVGLSVQVNLEMAKEVARHGADFVFTGDDYASAQQPFVSAQTFGEFLLPGLKRVVSGFKELGLPVIKHTDGNIMPLIDMIVDCDIDCLDPIDPVAGLDIGGIKKMYGDRIALKGNVNCAQTLTFGSVHDVVEETKEVIRKAATGGGLILSSSNSIHSAVKPGNYLAMWNAIRMYGKYPIKLDGWEDAGVVEAFS
ncbi:MAG: uroporphyrinogen decarboxylase family protein [Planctomycetota bacterium]|jgi:uroporphyrinogen decarboxylase